MYRNFHRFFPIVCGISLCSSSTYADSIPKMVQESALGCVKAPGLRFPQVGPMFQIWTHLRELNRGSFHAAQSRFLNHFRYNPTLNFAGVLVFSLGLTFETLWVLSRIKKIQLINEIN